MIKLVNMRIEGVSALLMHSPSGMKQVGETQRGGKKIPAPYDEAKAGLYVLSNGRLYIPSDAFRQAGLIAAKEIRDPSRKGRASMERRYSASVFLSREYFLLERPDKKAVTSADKDWSIDTRRVVIQTAGILRSRAKIEPWACELEMEYDDDLIDENLITAIMALAGKYPGVLDYRPGKKGPFGRFTVVDQQSKRKGGKR